MAGREPEQALKPWDLGRKGYREEGEARDERPLIAHSQFWKDECERLEWEYAVEADPIKVIRGPGGRFAGYAESTEEYLQRIVARVKGRPASIRSMPEARLPYREPGED
jgi:hypothetical protein